MTDKPAAIQVAHERHGDEASGAARVIQRFGVRARLVPVPIGIIEDVRQRITDPPVPTITLEDEGREIENPDDPAYLEAVRQADYRRGNAVLEAMCIFGVELLDGLPEGDTWRNKLAYYAKRGHIDLDWVDWDDPLEVEFVFVRYVLLTTDDFHYLGHLCGLGSEEIARAEETFRSN